MPKAAEIARFADDLLQTASTPDYPNAFNGLQVDTAADIRKIAAAVDFSSRTIRAAASAGANLLVVHHGAFWSESAPLTGRRYQMISELYAKSLGVYSSHLPLDRHPTIGNNVLLAEKLSLDPEFSFGQFQEISIGVAGQSKELVSGLMTKVGAFTQDHGGHAYSTRYSPERLVGTWAICTGSGADSSSLKEAAEQGVDTLIVGEGPHWTSVYAEDHDLVLIYAGHYATETLAVQALGASFASEFQIEWEFNAAPTVS
jgi:dinuclear metal center YbgI/SA1388 family protein